ncbi:hypothetical protein GQ457_07G024970 [Hibiscus cannabinus]
MKYLQDFIHECNKITCKTGILDEIINYVQSLQRQVELLKILGLTVNIDNLYAKEMFPSCTTNFPMVGNMPSELENHPPYLHFNPIQQAVSGCGVET